MVFTRSQVVGILTETDRNSVATMATRHGEASRQSTPGRPGSPRLTASVCASVTYVAPVLY